ncbi:hypothetical protein F441_16673 [Phytophthora nicotianae CJ01A1]|uniref:Uncharacterized protein n=4 Tax=Phytophthora nicotianae TaxID=4792 RepID=V9EF44_PHYNI|nr:hypothetical protein F443_16835 [Phytophthora nicotianae P1569]ETO65914.1 hypothetical protein F444_16848 [Phytophthora nicotianae P1976]ETP07019.1 hypothetical protein F441_16673 [Phytophthora nicotianae CJ01A1]ETP35114.1 hypothetical protein F442_16667 [Phytophthora nicotianae P10297]
MSVKGVRVLDLIRDIFWTATDIEELKLDRQTFVFDLWQPPLDCESMKVEPGFSPLDMLRDSTNTKRMRAFTTQPALTSGQRKESVALASDLVELRYEEMMCGCREVRLRESRTGSSCSFGK